MHDRLFEHQDALDDDSLIQHAVRIGLDEQHFVADLASHRYVPRIREDLASGARSGVNGTPTFFVNGVRYDGPPDVRSIVSALHETADVAAG
jgi:predicted DsbA family dithiol-disulfide isomerase